MIFDNWMKKMHLLRPALIGRDGSRSSSEEKEVGFMSETQFRTYCEIAKQKLIIAIIINA